MQNQTKYLFILISQISSKQNKPLAEQSFDARGRMRNPETWQYESEGAALSRTLTASLLNGRGYTAHEMLPTFALINMNGRLYDPQLGRMLSPDNYIQLPDYTQNFNRYSYVLNNPLKYRDPSGEWIGWDDAVIAGVGFVVGYVSYGIKNGDWGWKAVGAGAIGAAMAWIGYNTAGLATGAITSSTWGYAATIGFNAFTNLVMDPIQIPLNDNWSVSVSPSFFYSTEGFGAGIVAGVHYTDHEHVSITVYGSAQFGQGFVSKRQGFEFRLGAQAQYTWDNGFVSLGGNMFFSGETSQYDEILAFGGKKWSFTLEEDFDGKHDRYRTGAGQFTYKFDEDIEASFGFKAYTGDPGDYEPQGRKLLHGKYRRFYNDAKTSHKYLAGILYAGVNYKGQTFQAGWNSEKIRNAIQNVGIHASMSRIFSGHDWYDRGMDIPFFLMRPDLSPDRLYLYYGTSLPYSLY